MIKILICGSRSFTNAEFINRSLNNICSQNNLHYSQITVIEGAAKGVDTLAKNWAIAHNIPIDEYPADWNTYGKAAGPIRNEIMVKACDYAIIFWDGISRGTKNDIDLCKKFNKQYTLIIVENQ